MVIRRPSDIKDGLPCAGFLETEQDNAPGCVQGYGPVSRGDATMTPPRWTMIWAVAFVFLPVFFSLQFLPYMLGTGMGVVFLLVMGEVA